MRKHRNRQLTVACYQHEDGIENEDGELGDQIKIGEEMIPVDKW